MTAISEEEDDAAAERVLFLGSNCVRSLYWPDLNLIPVLQILMQSLIETYMIPVAPVDFISFIFTSIYFVLYIQDICLLSLGSAYP